MHVGDDHWLFGDEGDPGRVSRVPCANARTCMLDVPAPVAVVWHYTASIGGPTSADWLAKSIQTYDPGHDRPASWHALIAKDGRVLQSAPFNVGTWHVGRPGRVLGRLFGNVNRATVGIELDNAGELAKVGEKFYCFPYWLHPDDPPENKIPDPKLEIPAVRAVEWQGRYFDAYTPDQEDAAARLLKALVSKYGWKRGAGALGHYCFDFPRKADPGPLWVTGVLPRILDSVFGAVTPTDPPIYSWPPSAPMV